MEIDDKYKIEKSAETFAQIVPISVISDRYIQLGPVYESGEFLQNGDVLDTDITQIPAELDDVFKQLKKLLDAIEPGKKGEPGALGDLIVQLNRTLKDREQDLRGTLIHGAALTSTLSDAQDDISGLLVNLDNLFSRLATRANSIGELNNNFAVVMTALAESRSDLQGTLKNLADMTQEVGDLAADHGDRLGKDLKLAGRITSTIVDNRASVEESLRWLPVVGKGVSNAYHPPPNSDVDVRDNAQARLECKILDPLPDSPAKDALKELCKQETGEPGTAPTTTTAPLEEEKPFDCNKGIRKVSKQLTKLEHVGLPKDALDEIIKPFRMRLKALKKACKELGGIIQDPSSILDDLPKVPNLDDITGGIPGAPDVDVSDLPDLNGQAAGTDGVATTDEPSAWDGFRGWVGGFLGFLGVSS
jgi:phospholipid/cholesterol/gamma-HCH transport system substrate-binding protein